MLGTLEAEWIQTNKHSRKRYHTRAAKRQTCKWCNACSFETARKQRLMKHYALTRRALSQNGHVMCANPVHLKHFRKQRLMKRQCCVPSRRGGANWGKRRTARPGDRLVSETRPHGTDVAMAAPHDLRRTKSARWDRFATPPRIVWPTWTRAGSVAARPRLGCIRARLTASKQNQE